MGESQAGDALGSWSAWMPFAEAVRCAPLTPGVYMARLGATGDVVYVGMAGERHGRGIRGRLTAYGRGRGVVSGLGEAAMDRALSDANWLHERLELVERGVVSRTREWAAAALERCDLHIRWVATPDKASALELERKVLTALADTELWNRAR